MQDEITYPFPNYNGCTNEVSEWISYFIPHFIMANHKRKLDNYLSKIEFKSPMVQWINRFGWWLHSIICHFVVMNLTNNFETNYKPDLYTILKPCVKEYVLIYNVKDSGKSWIYTNICKYISMFLLLFFRRRICHYTTHPKKGIWNPTDSLSYWSTLQLKKENQNYLRVQGE